MIRTILAAAIMAAGLTVSPAVAGAPDLPARAWQMSTLCQEEDSTDCAWNAHTQGNGHGHSFYAVTRRLRSASGRHIVGRVDCHTFVGRHADHRWGECQLRRPIRSDVTR
jgi:hypothetical protein